MKITMQCGTANARIYYTLDGTTPTDASNLYTTPFDASNSVLKARAYKAGLLPSDVVTIDLTTVIGYGEIVIGFGDVAIGDY